MPEPHKKYTGETRFPLIVQNVHRYFFYAAVVISLINTYDAILAFHSADGGFGFGLGNVILVVNVVLLWALHAVVPLLPAHHRRPAQALLQAPGALPAVDAACRRLNTRHMQLAWITLGTLALHRLLHRAGRPPAGSPTCGSS